MHKLLVLFLFQVQANKAGTLSYEVVRVAKPTQNLYCPLDSFFVETVSFGTLEDVQAKIQARR